MKCRCMGLDNSRYCTGWCIIDIDTEAKNKKYREGMYIIDYGYIDTSKIKQEGETLIYIEDKLANLMDEYEPDVISAEQQFIGKNSQTGIVLAGIHAIMKLCAAKRKIPITYYAIMTMKSKTVGGIKLNKEDGTRKTGDELKQEVAQTIFNIFDNVQFNNITDDVTDAISAVITYVRMDGQGVGKQSADVKAKKAKKKVKSDKKNNNKLKEEVNVKRKSKKEAGEQTEKTDKPAKAKTTTKVKKEKTTK